MTTRVRSITGLCIIEPRVYFDERGFLFESFNERYLTERIGSPVHFVQENYSRSKKGVLRGLHYQVVRPQGKLVRVLAGEVFDVAVDIRKHSATFGKWFGTQLSARNMRQLWIPPGFAHGFLVVSDSADVIYKLTEYWSPEHDQCIRWDDAMLRIKWPLRSSPILSLRDKDGKPLQEAVVFE